MQGHHLNYVIRAGFKALLTGLTHNRVDSCNAVTNMNCVILTGIHAVAETDTAVDTLLRAAEKLLCHFA